MKIITQDYDRTICDECEQDIGAVIEIGEVLDYGSSTAWVCLDCLRKAVEMLENKEGKNDQSKTIQS